MTCVILFCVWYEYHYNTATSLHHQVWVASIIFVLATTLEKINRCTTIYSPPPLLSQALCRNPIYPTLCFLNTLPFPDLMHEHVADLYESETLCY